MDQEQLRREQCPECGGWDNVHFVGCKIAGPETKKVLKGLDLPPGYVPRRRLPEWERRPAIADWKHAWSDDCDYLVGQRLEELEPGDEGTLLFLILWGERAEFWIAATGPGQAFSFALRARARDEIGEDDEIIISIASVMLANREPFVELDGRHVRMVAEFNRDPSPRLLFSLEDRY